MGNRGYRKAGKLTGLSLGTLQSLRGKNENQETSMGREACYLISFTMGQLEGTWWFKWREIDVLFCTANCWGKAGSLFRPSMRALIFWSLGLPLLIILDQAIQGCSV